MNLQENIRRILREGGFVPLPIRRRISTDDLEDAFAYSLETNTTHMDNPNTILYKEKKPSLWVFSKFVIDDMVTLIEQEYFTNDNRIYFSDTDEDDETYHEKIRQPLLRHYGKRIKEKYDEVMSSNDEEIIQESIRKILREELNYTNLSVNIGDVYEESDIYTYIQKLHYKRDYDFWEGDLGERIEKFPYYIVKEVPIENIEMDEYQLDEDDMEEYIEMFKERGSYPPIVLGKKSYGYYNIIDGTHRANALRELGFDKIICFVGKKKI